TYTGDPIGNLSDAGAPNLPTNRILVRPSLNGDINMDGVVNGDDIGVIVSLGYFGRGTAPHGWFDGDVNGDGVVDGNDIGIIVSAGTFNNGSYGPRAAGAYGSRATGGLSTSASSGSSKSTGGQATSGT